MYTTLEYSSPLACLLQSNFIHSVAIHPVYSALPTYTFFVSFHYIFHQHTFRFRASWLTISFNPVFTSSPSLSCRYVQLGLTRFSFRLSFNSILSRAWRVLYCSFLVELVSSTIATPSDNTTRPLQFSPTWSKWSLGWIRVEFGVIWIPEVVLLVSGRHKPCTHRHYGLYFSGVKSMQDEPNRLLACHFSFKTHEFVSKIGEIKKIC